MTAGTRQYELIHRNPGPAPRLLREPDVLVRTELRYAKNMAHGRPDKFQGRSDASLRPLTKLRTVS